MCYIWGPRYQNMAYGKEVRVHITPMLPCPSVTFLPSARLWGLTSRRGLTSASATFPGGQSLLCSWKSQRQGLSQLWEKNLKRRTLPLLLCSVPWWKSPGQVFHSLPLSLWHRCLSAHQVKCVTMALEAHVWISRDLHWQLGSQWAKLGEPRVFALISMHLDANNK